jgi:hypothetical protein
MAILREMSEDCKSPTRTIHPSTHLRDALRLQFLLDGLPRPGMIDTQLNRRERMNVKQPEPETTPRRIPASRVDEGLSTMDQCILTLFLEGVYQRSSAQILRLRSRRCLRFQFTVRGCQIAEWRFEIRDTRYEIRVQRVDAAPNKANLGGQGPRLGIGDGRLGIRGGGARRPCGQNAKQSQFTPFG